MSGELILKDVQLQSFVPSVMKTHILSKLSLLVTIPSTPQKRHVMMLQKTHTSLNFKNGMQNSLPSCGFHNMLQLGKGSLRSSGDSQASGSLTLLPSHLVEGLWVLIPKS